MKGLLSLGVAALLAVVSPLQSAELPSRSEKPATASKTETCEIDGQSGFRAGEGGPCLRISGYVSAGVTVGNLAKSH